MDVLLQVLEAGRLTDGQGRTANFSEAVIILTSNLGSEYLQESQVDAEVREHVMEDVRAFFRPEFLNRLDDILIFNSLTPDVLRSILNLQLTKEAALAESRGIPVEFTDAAKQWMLDQNDHPEWGARPLRRIIGRAVRDRLADYLLAESLPRGEGLRFEVQPGATELTLTPYAVNPTETAGKAAGSPDSHA